MSLFLTQQLPSATYFRLEIDDAPLHGLWDAPFLQLLWFKLCLKGLCSEDAKREKWQIHTTVFKYTGILIFATKC